MLSDFLKDYFKMSNRSKHATRSTDRQDHIHSFIGKEIEKVLDKDKYYVKYKDSKEHPGELKFKGPLFDKKTDITVHRRSDDRVVAAIPIKMIHSNYKQNWKNYFEQMVGETVNLRLMGVKVYNFILKRKNTPYYTNGKKTISRIEYNKGDDISIQAYDDFASFQEGKMTNGIIFMEVDFMDTKTIEKYVSTKERKIIIDDEVWTQIHNDIVNGFENEEIEVKYPFIGNVNNALTFEEFISKIKKDIEEESEDRIIFVN